jgi:hypothetical protein
MKRIFLLIATNVAIMVVLSIVVSVFGFDRYLTKEGLNLQALLAFSAVLGFGGAFISLLISKWMAKSAMGVRVITEPRTETEQWLVNTVRSQAQTAGKFDLGLYYATDGVIGKPAALLAAVTSVSLQSRAAYAVSALTSAAARKLRSPSTFWPASAASTPSPVTSSKPASPTARASCARAAPLSSGPRSMTATRSACAVPPKRQDATTTTKPTG